MLSLLQLFISQNILLCFQNFEVGENNSNYNFFNQSKSKKLTEKELMKNINFDEKFNEIISKFNNILKNLESNNLIYEDKILELII